MDWENKFSSIVKETESNLARVRERLGTSNASGMLIPTNGKYSAHFVDSPMRGNKPFSRFDGKSYQYSHPSGISTINGIVPVPNTSTGKTVQASFSPVKSVGLPTNQTSSQSSPALINVLFERVEHQAEMVDSLAASVRSLEKHRVNQEAVIKNMEAEVFRLNERLRERGIDLETERKLEQFRQEVFSQLQEIQGQSRLQRVKDERLAGDSSTSTVARDLQESKRVLQENNDSLRREIDHLKTRIAKIELDLHSVISDTTDVLRRHDKQDRTIMSISENQRSTSRTLSEIVERRHVNDSVTRQLSISMERVSRQVADIETELRLMVGTVHSKVKTRSKKQSTTTSSRSSKKSLKNTPLVNGNFRTSKVKRSLTKSAPELLDLSLSDMSDVDLSLSTLELNSPSDSEFVSLQLDSSSKGFGYPLSSEKDESLSSFDSDDLLGESSQ